MMMPQQRVAQDNQNATTGIAAVDGGSVRRPGCCTVSDVSVSSWRTPYRGTCTNDRFPCSASKESPLPRTRYCTCRMPHTTHPFREETVFDDGLGHAGWCAALRVATRSRALLCMALVFPTRSPRSTLHSVRLPRGGWHQQCHDGTPQSVLRGISTRLLGHLSTQ